MKKIFKIIAIILITALIGGFLYYNFEKIKIKIESNKTEILYDVLVKYSHLEEMLEKEKKLSLTRDKMLTKEIFEGDKKLKQHIINLPKLEKLKKKLIEFNLRQAVVIIHNYTEGTQGSGVTIKYRDKFYVLSAGHLVNDLNSKLMLAENGIPICELKIAKQKYTADVNDSTGHDLLLLKPKNPNMKPKYYVEIEEIEPIISEEIYIVGNPMGIEDLLSEGRIIGYMDNFMYFYDHVYFGSSGGGVFTQEGNLVGILSFIAQDQSNPLIAPFVFYGAVRLNIIKDFLKGIE